MGEDLLRGASTSGYSRVFLGAVQPTHLYRPVPQSLHVVYFLHDLDSGALLSLSVAEQVHEDRCATQYEHPEALVRGWLVTNVEVSSKWHIPLVEIVQVQEWNPLEVQKTILERLTSITSDPY